MKKTNHISLYESFMDSEMRGSRLNSGSKDYTRGVICIADYNGGGLAVGTINSRSDESYIQELEQYQDQEIGIDVFPYSGDAGEFVSFTDDQFNIHRLGETYRVTDNGFVFTIPNGSFLVLTDGYNQYELLTTKEVRDYFAR